MHTPLCCRSVLTCVLKPSGIVIKEAIQDIPVEQLPLVKRAKLISTCRQELAVPVKASFDKRVSPSDVGCYFTVF